MIQISNLSKTYKKGHEHTQALKNISLMLPETGLVCILGESGSGKTTLLNAVGGLDDFQDGSIEAYGVKFTNYNKRIIEPLKNERFGYIFQNYYLLNDFSVFYNVRLALNEFDIPEEEKDKRVDYVLSVLGIEKLKNKPAGILSGGQQQRVAIARVLVKSPDVIFADEPTGNLDEENTLKTLTILKCISKNCLVLLVTHERNIAEFFADRIIEIKDGTVVNDRIISDAKAYSRSDDNNIYLKEFDKSVFTAEDIHINLYKEKGQGVNDSINLSLVLKDGKIYLKNDSGYDLINETPESGFRILDIERPTLNMDEVENFSFSLEKPHGKKKSRLPFNETLKIAKENIRMLKKKQLFMFVVMVLSAVLMTLTFSKFLQNRLIDEAAIVTTDSHYVKVDFTNIKLFGNNDQLKILDFADKYLHDKSYGDLFYTPKINLYLSSSEFVQMTGLLQLLRSFSYCDISKLDQSDIIFGRFPEKRSEVVVDIKVINRLINSDGIISSMLSGAESYIGAKLKTSIEKNVPLIIVGICDSGEPDIYCSQTILLSYDIGGFNICSADELKKESDGLYPGVYPEKNEILVRKGLFNASNMSLRDSIFIGDDKSYSYTVTGTFEDEYGIDYCLSEEGCERVRDLMICQTRTCLIYSNNPEVTANYVEESGKAFFNKFTTTGTLPYKEQIEEYKELIRKNMSTIDLISVVILIISFMIVYFFLKTNVISRAEEIVVYRLIGITESNIRLIYVLEMILISLYTTIPAIFVTTLVLNMISGVPSVNISLYISPLYSILLGFFIVLTDILVSIIPVSSFMKRPPAEMAYNSK